MKPWGLSLDQIAQVFAQNRNGPTTRVGDARSIKRQAARNARKDAKREALRALLKEKPEAGLLPRAELKHTHTHTQRK